MPKSARALDMGSTKRERDDDEAPPATMDDNVERPHLELERASDYETLETLGKGQFGVVTKAKRRRDDQVVAMKQLRFDFDKEGFPLEALREITLLSSIRHPNIVAMHAVACGDGDAPADWYLVMDPAGYELTSVVQGARCRPLTESQVKHLMLQLLRALAALHSVWVMHRDLKPANVLVDDRGVLRLCDFGLARRVCAGPELFEFEARRETIAGIELYGRRDGEQQRRSAERTHTPNVVSGHYRPPEVLLGVRDYGRSVDLWSAGCIFGELLSRTVLFAGKDEPDQLRQIFTLLGEPTAEYWPLYPHLARHRGFSFESATGHDLHRRVQHGGQQLLRLRFPAGGFEGAHQPFNSAIALVSPLGHVTTALSNTGFALLCRMLETCPERRITANDAKRDRWFSSKPLPEPLTPTDLGPLLQLAKIADATATAIPTFAATGFSNQPLPPILQFAAGAHPAFALGGSFTAPSANIPAPESRGSGAAVAQAIALARARALATRAPDPAPSFTR